MVVQNPPPSAVRIPDMLGMRVVPSSLGPHTLGSELNVLLQSALRLIADHYPDVPFVPEGGLIKHLTELLEIEQEPLPRQRITAAINRFRAYFHLPDPDKPETSAGQIRLSISEDKLTAFLTVTPPRGEGNIPTTNTVREVLNRAAVTYGIDMEAIEESLRTVREKRDLVWRAVSARGEPPVPHGPGKVEYRTQVIDKTLLRRDLRAVERSLSPLWKPVAEGEAIGFIGAPAPGRPGTDVFGKRVSAPKTPLSLDLGDVTLSPDNTLTSQAAGYVVVDGDRIDIVPLYLMEHPSPGTIVDFSFPGAVLVLGGLRGPGSIECEDLFVLGNCEQMKVVSRHDVFISGGVVGHHKTSIDADGGIYASFVSEAKLSALGEIVVANAILYSRVTCNDMVRVSSDKGMIAGGAVCALKGVVAATLGSEFGMLTETVVGHDFLAPARLKEIAEKIALHEDNLRRIQELKERLAKSKVAVERLPPDKQEIFIGVLRKEENSRVQLQSLLRRKKTLSEGLSEFLAASVQVLDTLYPPVRVQIADSIKEVTEKLRAVTLTYSKEQGIIDSTAGPTDEDHE